MANILGSSPVAKTTKIARTMVSGSVFGAGRKSLVSPLNAQPPVQLLVPQPREEIIESKLDSNQISLSFISKQLVGFSRQIASLSRDLQKITYYISLDSNLDIKRENQRRYQERLLAEEAIRDRQEGVIERKVRSLVSAPVKGIVKRTRGVLNNLMGFFTTLLFGWLTNQGIEAIKANIEGTKNKLEEIKNNVLTALGDAFKIFYLAREGFLTFATTIGKISLKIGKFLLSDVIGGIFKGLFNLAKGAAKTGQELIGAGGKAAKTAVEVVAEGAGKIATKEGSELLGKIGSKITPGLGTVVNLGVAAYRFKQGDIPGAALSVLSSAPLIGIPVVAADIYRDFGGFKGTFLESKQATQAEQQVKSETKPLNNLLNQSQPKENAAPPTPSAINPPLPSPDTTKATTQAQTTPQNNLTASIADFQFSIDKNNLLESSFGSQDFSKTAMYGDITLPPEVAAAVASQPPVAQVQPLPINQLQQNALTAPMPEPPPNIIMTKTSNQEPQNISATTTDGMANNIPAIPSSNPDNFYSLYSQIHYNVII